MFWKECRQSQKAWGSWRNSAWQELTWRELASKTKKWAGNRLRTSSSVPLLYIGDLILSAVGAVQEF